jgi:hypothetical protein
VGTEGRVFEHPGADEPYGRSRCTLPVRIAASGSGSIAQDSSAAYGFRLYVDENMVARNGRSRLRRGISGSWKPLTINHQSRAKDRGLSASTSRTVNEHGRYFYPIRMEIQSKFSPFLKLCSVTRPRSMGGLVVIGIYFFFFRFQAGRPFILRHSLGEPALAVRICTHGEMIFSHFHLRRR